MSTQTHVAEDIRPVRPRMKALWDFLVRFVRWWAGLFGLYAISGAPCPCCGKPACPTGALSAGVVGGVVAFAMQLWRNFKK